MYILKNFKNTNFQRTKKSAIIIFNHAIQKQIKHYLIYTLKNFKTALDVTKQNIHLIYLNLKG